jgi:hypothetical protein
MKWIPIYLIVVAAILFWNYCAHTKSKKRMSGLKINGVEVAEGDTVMFAYEEFAN